MKNRDYKEFATGEVYHIYNRGVDKMKIFRNLDDYRLFLLRLRESLFPEAINKTSISKSERRRKLLPSGAFDLICYCLMPNHFHLLVRQNKEVAVTKLLTKICTSFSMCFNKKYNHVGGVFQDQFKAVHIRNNEQLLWVSLYIHNNPINAGLTDSLEKYRWSSYLDYMGLRDNTLCNKKIILDQFNSLESYSKFFEDSITTKQIQEKIIWFQDLLIDNE